MDNEINALREELLRERRNTLTLAELAEEMVEVLSSEIPIQSPKRLEIEGYLPAFRAAISALRERVKLSGQYPLESDDSQRDT